MTSHSCCSASRRPLAPFETPTTMIARSVSTSVVNDRSRVVVHYQGGWPHILFGRLHQPYPPHNLGVLVRWNNLPSGGRGFAARQVGCKIERGLSNASTETQPPGRRLSGVRL